MKIRNGFVSNSSSSSFILLVTKELHEKLKEELDPFVIAVVEAMGEETKFFGKEGIVIPYSSDAGGCDTFEDFEIDFDGEVPKAYTDDGYRDFYSAYQEYVDEAEKHPEDHFSHSEYS